MTLKQFLDSLKGKGTVDKKVENFILAYRKMYENIIKNPKIKDENKIKKNTLVSLNRAAKSFFVNYLGFEAKIPTMSNEPAFKKIVHLEEVEALEKHIDKKYGTLIAFTNSEDKKINLRKRWALDRIIIAFPKYLWIRTKAYSEGYLTMGDIREMKKTGKLPLHIRKRLNRPDQYKNPVAVKPFLDIWNVYEQYRDSIDWSDDAPAVVNVDCEGRAIKRRWMRKRIVNLRREAGLSEDLTFHNIRKSMHTLISSAGYKKIAQIHLGDLSEKVANKHYDMPDDQIIRANLEEFYSKKMRIPGIQPSPIEKESKQKKRDAAYV